MSIENHGLCITLYILFFTRVGAMYIVTTGEKQ